MSFDIRSFLMVFFILAVLMGGLLLAIRRQAPGVGGIASMAAAVAILAPLMMFYAWRAELPDWLAFPVLNALIYCGLALMTASVARLFEVPAPIALLQGVVAVGTVCYVMAYLGPVPLLRSAVFTLTTVVLFGTLVHALLRTPKSRRRLGWAVMLGACLILVGLATARFLLSTGAPGMISAPGNAGEFWQHPANQLIAAASAIWLLFMGFAAVLAVSERTHDLLREIANIDPLTGLLSRRAFLDALEREFAGGDRQARPFTLAVCDLDHFKQINDRFGHPAGDAVLQAFARRVTATVRPSDLVGRLGGEEFGIALLGTPAAHALGSAERVRQAVEREAIVHEGRLIPLTVSIGLAQATPADALLERIFARADQALYVAKETRNRVALADAQAS